MKKTYLNCILKYLKFTLLVLLNNLQSPLSKSGITLTCNKKRNNIVFLFIRHTIIVNLALLKLCYTRVRYNVIRTIILIIIYVINVNLCTYIYITYMYLYLIVRKQHCMSEVSQFEIAIYCVWRFVINDVQYLLPQC